MFTDFESSLYDRQIRLWGVEAQRRLNAAKILIIGINGLGAEVGKNLILGGVKSIVLMDHRIVGKLDLANQFLVGTNAIGQNRAAASLVSAQQLNPMVDVAASCCSPDDKNDLYFEQFTLICACGCTKSQINRLNRITRQYGIQFFAADVFGFTSYIFVDLGKTHTYSREVTNSANKDLNKVVTASTTFCPFQEILEMKWTQAPVGLTRKTKPSIHVIMVLLEFMEKFKRPMVPNFPEDRLEFEKLLETYISSNRLSIDLIQPILTQNICGQLGPVCAITGGVLAQEIVKAISHKDKPMSNLFVFDPYLGTGVVEKFSRADTPGVYVNA